MASHYSRVTLIGRHRHADVLLPSQTPIGTLLPQIFDLLAEEPGQTPAVRGLYRTSGQQLEPRATLEESAVLDGETLRLADSTAAPDAPVIYDLHDTVAAETDSRGRWDLHARQWIQGVVAVLLGWWSATRLTTGLPDDQSALVRLGIGAALFLSALAVHRWAGHRACALTLLAAATAIALDGHWWLMATAQKPLTTAVLVALCAGVPLLLATGLITRHRRALSLAAAVLAALTAAWAAGPTIAGWLIGDRSSAVSVTVGSLTGVTALLVLAVLAQAAAAHAGLTGLDDQESAGARLLRTDVTAAVAAAHEGMILGVIVSGASLAVSLWLVSEDTAHPAFSVAFICVLTLATWLRARAFPLSLQRGVLHLTTAWGLWCTTRLASAAWPTLAFPLLTVLGLIAVALLALQATSVPAHMEARARRIGHVVETLAVVALIPLLVGYTGLYSAMLETF